MPRLLLGSVLAAAVLTVLAPAGAAPIDARGGTNGFYRLRPDPRACPSPMCGGWFATPVNLRSSAYVAELDLSQLGLSPTAQGRLESDLAGDRALVRGRIVAAEIDGFPDLRKLVATEAWRAATSAPSTGTVYRVEDRGLRCVAAPCFSLHAAVLGIARHTDLSDLDLAAIRPPAVRGRIPVAAAHSVLLLAGRARPVPNAGPAGDGRELVVAQAWFRSARG